MIYELENNENLNIYKKIINMIPLDYLPRDYCNEFGYYPNKKITSTTNLYINSNDKFDPLPNKKEITFMINKNINNEKNLEDTWWYKYYFNIPICAYGRLTQSTGTCWCNSLINVILLTPSIYEFILEKFNNLPETEQNKIRQIKSFDDFIGSDYDLTTLIYATINILIVNKSKAKQKNGNFIIEIAARIKSIYFDNDEDFYKLYSNNKEQKKNAAIEYGDGGLPSEGITVIFNKIFKEDKDFIKINYNFNLSNIDNIKDNKDILIINKITMLIDKYFNESDENKKKLIGKELYSLHRDQINLDIQYSIYKKIFNKRVIENNINQIIDEIIRIIPIEDQDEYINIINNNILNHAIEYNEKKDLKIPTNLIIDKFSYEFKNNLILSTLKENNISLQINDITPPKILLVEYELLKFKNDEEFNLGSNAPDTIKINDIKYIIQGSTLIVTGNAGHSICGLKCNNDLYVYDSNNYLVYTNWNKYNALDKTNNQYRELLISINRSNNDESDDFYDNYPGNSKVLPPYLLNTVVYIREDS
jgi:hypothetical protein